MKETGAKEIEKEGLQLSLANKLLLFQPMHRWFQCDQANNQGSYICTKSKIFPMKNLKL